MSKFLAGVFLFGMFAVLIGYQNCGMQQIPVQDTQNTAPNSQLLKVSGTVEQSTVDGCNILVHSVDDQTGQDVYYNPVRGDPAVFSPGNTIEMTALLRPDLVGICMKGDIVQVEDAHIVGPLPSPSP